MTYKRISPTPIAEGGTAKQSFTAYSVICGGTTSTGALQNVSGVGTSGQLLVSAGASALPVWTSTTGITTGGASSVLLVDSSNLIGTIPGGATTLNTGTQALNISSDASATTVAIGTGGAAKTVTLGSTNTTSSTVIKSGSGNIVMNSGLTVDSTGRSFNTTQPAFTAYLSTPTANNKFGDTTTYYTVLFDTKVFDQGTNYNTGTGTFTAPIAGKYIFTVMCSTQAVSNALTFYIQGQLVTTARSYYTPPFTQNANNPNGFLNITATFFADMAASDTAYFAVVGSYTAAANSMGVYGSGSPYFTYFSGALIC